VLKWISIVSGVLAVVLLAFIGLAMFFGAEFRAAWRDVFIVVMVALQLLGAILTVGILIAVLVLIDRLDKLARNSLLPRLDDVTGKVNEVLDTTRGLTADVRTTTHTAAQTTVFVAERVVTPVIKLAGLLSGARSLATAFARRDTPDETRS
jgi:hypothetical protein